MPDIVALRVAFPWLERLPPQGGGQRPRQQAGRGRPTEQVLDRAEDVGEIDDLGDPSPRFPQSGVGQDQRDTEVRLIQEHGVPVLAMLPEGFTVIAGHDDERLVGQTLRLEPLHEPLDLAVDEGDLAVVEVRADSPEGLRRFVGLVRVEVVDPGEERLLLDRT
jgi:hypothetical protein